MTLSHLQGHSLQQVF